MQNTYPTNDPQNEINIKEILLLLFNSKKIIILITLISMVISLFINTFKAPIFDSYAKIIIGTYLHTDTKTGEVSNIQIQKIKDIQSEIVFNFDTSIVPIGQKFFSINSTNSSIEDAETIINRLIEFVNNRSKELINEKIEQDELNLFRVNSQIFSTERELNRLLTESNNSNSDSATNVYLSQIIVKLDDLELEKEVLEEKLNKPNLFQYTRLYGDIVTTERKTSQLKIAILGFIFGIAISLLYIFTKRQLTED